MKVGVVRAGYLFVILILLCVGTRAEAIARDADDYENQCKAYFGDEPLLSLGDVRKFIEENAITSAREFVAKMEKHPDFDRFLNLYVLQHTSRSAQRHSVSKDHPRVIMFHRGVIFGVTDHPTKSNARVEMIAYDPANHEFKFHLIDFRRKSDPIIEKPTSCLECHGNKPLPIWATYRTWPGTHPERSAYAYVTNPELAKLTADEVTALKDQLRKLYSGKNTKTARAEAARIEKLFEPVPRKMEGIYAHLRQQKPREDAAAFNGFLNRLNYHRIAHEIQRSENYDRYRYAFLGALFHCDDLPGFLGQAQAAHERNGRSFKDLLKETDEEMRAGFKKRMDVAKELGDEVAQRETQFADEDDIEPIAGLRYLFEHRGVDVKRFSYNFNPKESHGWGFSEVGAGTGGLRYSFCSFLPEALRADKELLPLIELAPSGMVSRSAEKTHCGLLRGKSISAMEQPSEPR